MTDARSSGLIREALYARTGSLRVAGLVREVLRTTSSGGATTLYLDDVIREVLRSAAAQAPAPAFPPRRPARMLFDPAPLPPRLMRALAVPALVRARAFQQAFYMA